MRIWRQSGEGDFSKAFNCSICTPNLGGRLQVNGYYPLDWLPVGTTKASHYSAANRIQSEQRERGRRERMLTHPMVPIESAATTRPKSNKTPIDRRGRSRGDCGCGASDTVNPGASCECLILAGSNRLIAGLSKVATAHNKFWPLDSRPGCIGEHWHLWDLALRPIETIASAGCVLNSACLPKSRLHAITNWTESILTRVT